MRRAMFSLAAGVVLTVGTLTGTGTATAAAAADCSFTALYGNTPIYYTAFTNSAVVGHLNKGTTATGSCNKIFAGSYTACGATNSTYWYFLYSRGYVKGACVS